MNWILYKTCLLLRGMWQLIEPKAPDSNNNLLRRPGLEPNSHPTLKLEGCWWLFTSHLQIKFLNLISSSKALCKRSTFSCKQSSPEIIWTMAMLMWPRITFFLSHIFSMVRSNYFCSYDVGNSFQISCRLHRRCPLLWLLEKSSPETIWTMAVLMWPRITFFLSHISSMVLLFLWCGQYFSNFLPSP